METIILKGKVFSYIINRKKIKNLYIRWHKDHFVVNMPLLWPKKDLLRTFTSKEEALYKMATVRKTRHELCWEDGETISFMGNNVKICYSSTTRLTENMLYLRSDDPRNELLIFAKKSLKQYVELTLNKYFLQMYPNKIVPLLKYRVVKGYFGQYNARHHTITFNILLAFVEPCLIDYVIVHELCHLRYMNHQSEFKEYEYQIMPDYKIRQKRLKSEAIRL